MHKKRMEILGLLYKRYMDGLGSHTAVDQYNENMTTLKPEGDYRLHLRALIGHGLVAGAVGTEIAITPAGIKYCEDSLKPWYQKVREAITEPKTVAGFFYALLGLIIGFALGKL